MAKDMIRQTLLLHELRKSASGILGLPFTERIDHRASMAYRVELALWAEDCAWRALPFFEDRHPDDQRPRRAIETLHEWIWTGTFSMKTIRSASLDAHAAAKAITERDAILAAHSAGQAVGTAHVSTHSFGAAIYAIRAAAAHTGNVDDGLVVEFRRQLQMLRTIVNERGEGTS